MRNGYLIEVVVNNQMIIDISNYCKHTISYCPTVKACLPLKPRCILLDLSTHDYILVVIKHLSEVTHDKVRRLLQLLPMSQSYLEECL